MAEFLDAAKKNTMPLVTINHLIIDPSWLTAIRLVNSSFATLCAGIPHEKEGPDMNGFRKLFKISELTGEAAKADQKALPAPAN